MFKNGFEKVAYSMKEHHIDMESTDLKHQATKNPVKHGLGFAAGGAAVGAGLGGLAGAGDGSLANKALKKLKKVDGISASALRALKKNPKQIMAVATKNGIKSGGLKGLALGSLLGAVSAHRILKGKKLESMPTEERKAYLAGNLGY